MTLKRCLLAAWLLTCALGCLVEPRHRQWLEGGVNSVKIEAYLPWDRTDVNAYVFNWSNGQWDRVNDLAHSNGTSFFDNASEKWFIARSSTSGSSMFPNPGPGQNWQVVGDRRRARLKFFTGTPGQPSQTSPDGPAMATFEQSAATHQCLDRIVNIGRQGVRAAIQNCARASNELDIWTCAGSWCPKPPDFY